MTLLLALVLCSLWMPGQAKAQQVKVTVLWNNDYTTGTDPNTSAKQDNDPVAGPAKIHVALQAPSNLVAGSAQIEDVEIDEAAGHYAPKHLGGGTAFNAMLGPGDDPTATNVLYANVDWPTNQATAQGYHNGLHTLTVKARYRVNNANAGNGGNTGGGGNGGAGTPGAGAVAEEAQEAGAQGV